MKKFITFLFAMLISITAMAYDFTGKTFKGTAPTNMGTTATVTVKFRANNRATIAYSGKGYGSHSDSNVYWEVSGDFINLMDSSGSIDYLAIGYEDGKVTLSMLDDYGDAYLTMKEAAASTGKSTSKGKSKRRR